MGLGSRAIRFLDAKREGVRLADNYVVAGMATMPSRSTFDEAFLSLIRQVDRLYLYLDGHDRVPAVAANHPRVIPIMAHEFPGLHANGKLIGLTLEQRPCLYVCADDDLFFRRDFVAKLRAALAGYSDRAVVGLFGMVFARPYRNFKKALSINYPDRLAEAREVDVLGTGAIMFSSSVLNFDVRDWPHGNMADMGTAIEAARAGIPMISIARRRKRVVTLAVEQPDSLVLRRRQDNSRQKKLAEELLRLRPRLAATH